MHQKKFKNGKAFKPFKFDTDSRYSCGSNDSQWSDVLQSKKLRIMNYNLIQIEGIPKHLASVKLLASKNCLGRYGAITNIFLAQPKDQNGKVAQSSNAYVTYQSEINSSLALLGVHNLEVSGKKVSAFFGTNRYCYGFLLNKPCTKDNCFYLHKFDLPNEAQKAEHSREKHLERAFSKIINNLNKIIWIEKEEVSGGLCIFRSVQLVIQRMIKKGLITEEEYEKAKKKGKVASERVVVLTKNINQVQIPSILTASLNVQTKKKLQTIPENNRMSSSMRLQDCFPHFKDLVKTSENSDYGNDSFINEDINDRIVEKILRELNKKRSLSRLDFAQEDFATNSKVLCPPENEKTKMIRQKMMKSLLQK